MDIKSLSVLVPMYNEKDNVERTIGKISGFMPTLGVGWEIVAVDDGSEDGTGEALDSMKDDHVRVFHHEVNRGQAAALKTGFMNARCDAVITIDSDLSFGLKNMEKLFRAANSSRADVVLGISQFDKSIPKHRIMISNLGNFVYRSLFPVKLEQYTCNFRLYRSEVAKAIRFNSESRFVGKVQIILDLARKDTRMVQVRVKSVPRKKGKSKFKFKDIFHHLRFAFTIIGFRLSRST